MTLRHCQLKIFWGLGTPATFEGSIYISYAATLYSTVTVITGSFYTLQRVDSCQCLSLLSSLLVTCMCMFLLLV